MHEHVLQQRFDAPGHFGCETCPEEWDDLHASAHEYARDAHTHRFEVIERVRTALIGSRGFVVQFACACGYPFAAVLVPRQARAVEVGAATHGARFDPQAA